MKIAYKPLLSWLSLAVLVVLVCVLGALQYRWLGEVSQIEQVKIQNDLQTSLNEVSRDFNIELNSACTALRPTDAEVGEVGREPAYERRYAQWRNSANDAHLFSRIAIAWDQDGQLALRMLDFDSGAFANTAWPGNWNGVKERLEARLRGGPPGSFPFDTTVIDLPRFSIHPGEQEWLLAEVDPAYVASALLPASLVRHLGSNYQTDYQIDVVERANPGVTIYHAGSQGRLQARPAASVALFDVMPQPPPRVGPGGPGGPEWGRRGPGLRPGRGGPAGRWLLSIRLTSGSLETVVERVRLRNLAISGTLLLLMLITGAVLVRISRQAQRLAQIEMEFVAGVSHELRTPLTVIRTAAFNLRGRLANNPSQVERYGTLIRQESEKLTAIVEQVLQFAGAKHGRIIREREPASVENIVADSLQASRGILDETTCRIEQQIEPGLPLILADSMALQHALQNLIGNAVKYGMEGGHWIGIFARSTATPAGPMIEIRISDRGPGIPREEQRHIFDAFFRGKKAADDQIHGTGLGLNLVKQIVEAHGGTVEVESEPDAGASFIVRIPAAPTEQQDNVAHSLGRG